MNSISLILFVLPWTQVMQHHWMKNIKWLPSLFLDTVSWKYRSCGHGILNLIFCTFFRISNNKKFWSSKKPKHLWGYLLTFINHQPLSNQVTWIKAWMHTHKGGLHWLYGKWMSWRLQNKCKLTGRVLCRYIPTSSVQERLDVICSSVQIVPQFHCTRKTRCDL